MHVAIDARPALDPRKTGVGYYTKHMIHRLPAADPDMSFTAWYLHAKGLLRPRRFFADVRAANFSERASPFPARLFEPVSARMSMPRLEWFLGFDALLATNFLPPATRSRGVVLVVHDLAYRRFPETAPQIDARWSRRFRRALQECAGVIVPSASAREDLLGFCAVEGGRVHVVPHGVDPSAFRPASEGAVAAVCGRLGIQGDYMLFVGGIEPRKNLPNLVRAFARASTGVTLVVAGGPVRWFPSAAPQLRAVVDSLPPEVRRRVVLTGYVSEAEKVALLTGATALAFPSRYEGFGFPVLEAMACGTPVLTSSVSSLPEVAGDAALLVDPDDLDAMSDAMGSLVSDEALRDRLREAGLARAAAFTWGETARRTAEVLRLAAT